MPPYPVRCPLDYVYKQFVVFTIVFAVPSAIQPIQNVNITEGQNLTLLCNVSGSPLPMVSWIKVGGDMSTNGSELVFTNISRTQAGEYMCEASNLCGNASETATIEVQCKSIIVSDYYMYVT